MQADDSSTGVESAFRDVLDAATNDLSRDWDAERHNGDFLAIMPAELSSMCFELLDIRDRITVSRVSRAWRRAALSNRSLWNRYCVPRTQRGLEVAAEALSTLLARSHPLPFRFECSWSDSNAIPSAVYDILFANVGRLAELHLDDVAAAGRLMHSAAPLPLLKRLSYNWAGRGNFYEFPAHWGAQNVPRLKDLTVWGLALAPDCQPFAALRSLFVYLPEGRTPAVSFSAVFPHLTNLELCGVTSAMLPMLTPPPLALQLLALLVEHEPREPIDYSRLFHSVRAPCTIRKLRVDSALGFLDALELFVRTFSGPWKMQIGSGLVVLRDLDSAASWSILARSGLPQRLDQEQNGAALGHLQRLAELRLPLAAFAALYRVHWARMNFPRLRALMLEVNDTRDVAVIDALTRDNLPTGGVALPALEFIELGCTDRLWRTGAAHRLLLALLAENSISTLYIHEYFLSGLSQADVAPFLQFAERVLVGTDGNPEHAELVFMRSAAEAGVSR